MKRSAKSSVAVPAFLFILSLLLTACRGMNQAKDSGIEEDLSFSVNAICDLTDSEGKTLHCGGINDFSGEIDGKAEGMSGDDPAWFNFKLPYSASYLFESDAKSLKIMCSSLRPSSVECDQAASVEWKPDGWTVRGEDTTVILRVFGTASETAQYIAELTFTADKEVNIRLTDGEIELEHCDGTGSLVFYDSEKMLKTEQIEFVPSDGTAAIIWDNASASSVELTDRNGKNEVELSWNHW